MPSWTFVASGTYRFFYKETCPMNDSIREVLTKVHNYTTSQSFSAPSTNHGRRQPFDIIYLYFKTLFIMKCSIKSNCHIIIIARFSSYYILYSSKCFTNIRVTHPYAVLIVRQSTFYTACTNRSNTQAAPFFSKKSLLSKHLRI